MEHIENKTRLELIKAQMDGIKEGLMALENPIAGMPESERARRAHELAMEGKRLGAEFRAIREEQQRAIQMGPVNDEGLRGI